MNTKERFKQFIKFKNLTVSAFESFINASNGYVNSISKSIGGDKIVEIIRVYPNLNLEWLINGLGEMIKVEAIAASDTNDKDDYIIKLQKDKIEALENEIIL